MQNLKLSALKKIVLIGASTGGPGQIQKIITSLPKLNDTSIIIAQHMAVGFIPSFVSRLKDYTSNPIELAQNEQALESEHIYLCCGNTSVVKNSYGFRFIHTPATNNSYNPDINVLFNSFVAYAKDIDTMSIILTGIGEDGVYGCKELSINGATCITETAKSAVVDGMTSRAREGVPNIIVLDIDDIIDLIKEFCN